MITKKQLIDLLKRVYENSLPVHGDLDESLSDDRVYFIDEKIVMEVAGVLVELGESLD